MRDALHLVEIGALHPAVAVDAGVDERPHAAVAQAMDGLLRRQLGGLRPARRGDVAAARVDRHHDPRAELVQALVEEVDVAEGLRADDRALGPGAQRLAHRVDGAQPAAVLDRDAGGGDDGPQVLERAWLARLGAVEVDDVKEARALLDPGAGGLDGLVGVGRGVLEAALDEPDGVAVQDVDRRVEDHATTRSPKRAKLRSSERPSREDFSGWNCAPITLPRSTIEANGSP